MQASDSAAPRIVLVGGGTMGADIAAGFLACGWRADIVNPHDVMGASLDQRLRAAMRALDADDSLSGYRRHERLDTVPWNEIDLVIELRPSGSM